MNTESSDFITVDECAGLLRLNRKTVYDAIKGGQLAGARTVRGTIRIHRPTLLASFDGGDIPLKRRQGR